MNHGQFASSAETMPDYILAHDLQSEIENNEAKQSISQAMADFTVQLLNGETDFSALSQDTEKVLAPLLEAMKMESYT